MGTIVKEELQEFSVYHSLEKFYYSFHFYFYERKKNKCMHVFYCDIILIKEDCCWLFFFKLSTEFNLILYSHLIVIM